MTKHSLSKTLLVLTAFIGPAFMESQAALAVPPSGTHWTQDMSYAANVAA